MNALARPALEMTEGTEGGSTPASRRLLALGGLTISATLLSIAAWTVPDQRGLGTHEQLGLPPCLSVVLWGLPCPTCGMCTAFAHTVRGEIAAAFHAQPAGLALATSVVMVAVASVYVLAFGRAVPSCDRRARRKALALGVAVFAVGWFYKGTVMYLSR